jgi:protein tyrosine/serine phosphatase
MQWTGICSRNRTVVIPLACVMGIAILFIGYTADKHKTLYHFGMVDQGKLYRSGTLSRRGLEKVHSLTNIRTIVNLRSRQEMNEGDWYHTEQQFTSENGIALINIPMLTDTPPDTDQIGQFLNVATDPKMLPVLVHCEMGVIRTGMMVAVYQVAVLGEPNSKVLASMPMFGHTFDGRTAVKDFILSFTPDRVRMR